MEKPTNDNLEKQKQLDQALKQEKTSFLGFFIKNYRVTYLIIIAILILGLFSLSNLPREADPEVKIPFAVVNTIYPGASPSDVEELVTDKIEEKVKNLDNLRRYTSSSGQGFSSVFVEFEAEAELQPSYQKLRDAVDEAKPLLPEVVEDPIVTEIRVSDFPIVSYSIVADLDQSEFKQYADLIATELEGISGVSKVDIIGASEREFGIFIDQTKLLNFNISLNQVISAISRANFNLPAGEIEIDGYKYNVRIKNKFESIDQLKKTVVATYNSSPIYLSDIAVIKDGYKDKKTDSKIGFSGRQAENTVSLQVYKKTGGNIINIVSQADKLIHDLEQSDKLPSYIEIEKTDDNAWYIKDSLNRLGASGLQTMFLIVAILFLVLGLRGAIITGLSVPIAFLMAFVALYIQGETLNSIVLYSLVISLGLMVDNSIIIMEGINEYITKYNKNPLEAAILSVWNFKWAITSGTMTTVAAFAPMLLVSGILGEYFSFIPKTISATLLSSLFVALVVIPTLASRFIKLRSNGYSPDYKGRRSKKVGVRYQFCAHCVDKVRKIYQDKMKIILSSKRRRRQVLISAWILFFIAIAIPISGLMKIEMFPPIDFDRFLVTVELPPGTPLETTKQKTTEVEQIIGQIPELKNYLINLGSRLSLQGTSGSGSHLATFTVNLVEQKKRQRKVSDITEQLRPKLKTIQNADIGIEQVAAGPPSGAPIEVRIFGQDLNILADLSTQVKTILNNIEGTVNIDDSLEQSTAEFSFVIDKQQANYYGLDVATVASTIRTAIYGAEASIVNVNGDDIDITVKYDQSSFTTIDQVENILIFTPTGQSIPLKQIAALEVNPSLLAINHRNSSRIVTVTSFIQTDANLQQILSQFDQAREQINIPSGYNIQVGGEVEDIEQSYQETFLSMIIAIILIAFILVLQFNSFTQPLIILTALPLAIIGVIFGLNVMQMSFSFPVFLGIVSLAGIAVNDAIVLVDRVNKNLSTGMEKVEGIIEAGLARMQPIFLTSLTTIAGIIPLAFADEIWRGFSITLIFGLIFSTALTLVVIPILYVSFTRKNRFN